MAYEVKVSYGANGGGKIGIGEFTAETYGKIPKGVKAVLKEVCERIEFEKVESLNVTINAKFIEDDED